MPFLLALLAVFSLPAAPAAPTLKQVPIYGHNQLGAVYIAGYAIVAIDGPASLTVPSNP